MPNEPKLAIIGGSGLYSMPGLQNPSLHDIETPFGKPSAPIVVGDLSGNPVAFLARHGIGHVLSPSEVNYRANIYALKSLGVEQVVSISACGSLREDYAPGDIVIPDGLLDFTRARVRSFFGDGLVAHINIADSFCPRLSNQVAVSLEGTGVRVHTSGVFITIEGPRFSTRAESNIYRSWGMSIIGMTTSPEAFLAREAELCYAVMAHVTDYDVWHISELPVTVEQVVRVLAHNTQVAQKAVGNLAQTLPVERTCGCGNALADALITSRDKIPPATRQRLALLVKRYLD